MSDDGLTAKDGAAESALHAAAWAGDLQWVQSKVFTAQALVADGADVNWKDTIGETALHGAAAWGHAPMVAFLIAHGVDVNAQESCGLTALHYAASHGGLETVRVLLAAGAAERLANTGAPLDLAKRRGRSDIVESLEKHFPQQKP